MVSWKCKVVAELARVMGLANPEVWSLRLQTKAGYFSLHLKLISVKFVEILKNLKCAIHLKNF